jgi:hypothetical protein
MQAKPDRRGDVADESVALIGMFRLTERSLPDSSRFQVQGSSRINEVGVLHQCKAQPGHVFFYATSLASTPQCNHQAYLFVPP